MDDRSDDVTCLFGLDGLAVESVVLTALEIRIVQLVTCDPDAARCPACGLVSTSGKEWVLTRSRDLPCVRWCGVSAVAQAVLALPHERCPQQTALLGHVDGRTSVAVRTWLAGRSAEFRDAIDIVVIDPHAGYAAAVRAALPRRGSPWITSI